MKNRVSLPPLPPSLSLSLGHSHESGMNSEERQVRRAASRDREDALLLARA